MTCTAPRHGDRYAYNIGCRCDAAIEANRAYGRAWRKTAAGARRQQRYNERRRELRAQHPDPRTAARLRRQALATAMHESGTAPWQIARELRVSTRTVERYLHT